jgi:uncharacterized membrane protein YfcA
MTLLVILATGIGATLVLLGAGGSILTVPLLMYGAGLGMHAAVATSLVMVGVVAAVATGLQWRRVNVRTGLLVGVAGMAGTIPGVWLNHRLPEVLLLVGFATTLLLVAVRLGGGDEPVAGRQARVLPTLAAGLAAGVATGLFGVGGGFVIVPVLVLLIGLAMREAVATSLFGVALNSLAAVLGHLAYGAIDWPMALAVTTAALFGGVVARPFAHRLSGLRLQQTFAASLMAVGLVMLAHAVRQVLA